MGSFERFIILTVVFLAAVVLAVTFRAEGPLGQKSPSEALAAAGREAALNPAPRELDLPAGRSVEAGDPAAAAAAARDSAQGGLPSGAQGPGAGAPVEESRFVNLDAARADLGAVPASAAPEARPGLLSAPARPAEAELRLWPGPEQNALGQPRMLRDVPGLERYPVAGEDLAVFLVPAGATWPGLARLLYGDEAEAEALLLANDAPGEPVAGSRVLVPIYRGQMGAVSLDQRPVQVQPRNPGNPGNPAVGTETAGPSERGERAATSASGAEQRGTQPAAAPTAGASTAARTYEVLPGDSLSSIAQRFYGSPNEWRKIFAANQDVLPNPDRLTPKMVLRIP